MASYAQRYQRLIGRRPDDVLANFVIVQPPVNILGIVLDLGVGVVQSESPRIGLRVANSPRPPTQLCVPTGSLHEDPQIRYYLAHLFARLLQTAWHPGLWNWFAENAVDVAAVEANMFAADLLLPIWLMTPYRHQTPQVVARDFRVPLHMAEHRLQNLW